MEKGIANETEVADDMVDVTFSAAAAAARRGLVAAASPVLDVIRAIRRRLASGTTVAVDIVYANQAEAVQSYTDAGEDLDTAGKIAAWAPIAAIAAIASDVTCPCSVAIMVKNPDSNNGLSAGVIAGAVIGALCGCVIIVAIIGVAVMMMKKKNRPVAPESSTATVAPVEPVAPEASAN